MVTKRTVGPVSFRLSRGPVSVASATPFTFAVNGWPKTGYWKSSAAMPSVKLVIGSPLGTREL